MLSALKDSPEFAQVSPTRLNSLPRVHLASCCPCALLSAHRHADIAIPQEEKKKGIPGKFILLDSTLTIEDGTVAPAGAVRRSVVLAEQASAIHAVC